MRRPALTRAGAASLLLLASVPAAGGQIVLQISSTAQLRGDVLALDLIVLNAGDEAAFSLRPSLALHERELLGASRESLAAGASFETTLALPVPGLAPGRWPFRVAVDYTDARNYPFQALQLATIDRGSAGESGLELVGIDAPALSGRGALGIRVRNPGSLPRRAAIALAAARDLEVEESGRSIALAPGQQLDVKFALGPRTALAGSRYTVFAIVEYDEAGVHRSLVRESVVLVQERRGHLAPGLLSASAALMLVWFVALRRRSVARPPG